MGNSGSTEERRPIPLLRNGLDTGTPGSRAGRSKSSTLGLRSDGWNLVLHPALIVNLRATSDPPPH